MNLLTWDAGRGCYVGVFRKKLIAVTPEVVAAQWAQTWRWHTQSPHSEMSPLEANERAQHIALSCCVHGPQIGKNPGVLWLTDFDKLHTPAAEPANLAPWLDAAGEWKGPGCEI